MVPDILKSMPFQPVVRHKREPKVKFNCELYEYDDVTVAFCAGRIVFRDEASALSRKICDLLSRTKCVVLELSGVEMIDSAGLGELVLLLMYAQAAGCTLKVAAPRKKVHQLLELTNLTSIFEIHPTLLDAMLAFQGQAA